MSEPFVQIRPRPEAPPKGDGNKLLRQVQNWAHEHFVPLNVSIEVTMNCNIRCVHCYNFDRDRPRKESCESEPALSTAEIIQAMTDLRQAGTLFLGLTGGEVLSHPDLFQFLDHARDLNLAVQLLTNGTLLRPGVVGKLASYANLMGTSISLYGATPDVHDAITQVRGSFRRTWDGIERLRARKLSVRLKFIIMRQNMHEVAAMMASASDRGYPFLIDHTITARHDQDDSSLKARVSPEDLKSLYRGPLRSMLPTGKGKVTEETFPCNCARGNCSIASNGDVYPCVSVPWTAGNIRKQSFDEIWKSSPVFQQIRGLRIADYPKCAPCPHKAWCSRSRGAAFTASGQYTGTDPGTCATAEIAHALNP